MPSLASLVPQSMHLGASQVAATTPQQAILGMLPPLPPVILHNFAAVMVTADFRHALVHGMRAWRRVSGGGSGMGFPGFAGWLVGGIVAFKGSGLVAACYTWEGLVSPMLLATCKRSIVTPAAVLSPRCFPFPSPYPLPPIPYSLPLPPISPPTRSPLTPCRASPLSW